MQVAKVLACARKFAPTTQLVSTCRPRGLDFFSTCNVKSHVASMPCHLSLNKNGLSIPYLLRNVSSRTMCYMSLVDPLNSFRVKWKTIDKGRTLIPRIFLGLAIGTGCQPKEGLAEITHCERDHQSERPPLDVAKWPPQKWPKLGRVIKRFWLPSLCVLTISLGWHSPVSLLVNLIFLMWSTKPSPSSIYIWVEERGQEDALKRHGLDRMKAQASAVMHVEVRDNMFFCLARVTSLTRRSTLVGLLGDWWVIYSSSSTIDTGVTFRSLIPTIRPYTSEQFSIS